MGGAPGALPLDGTTRGQVLLYQLTFDSVTGIKKWTEVPITGSFGKTGTESFGATVQWILEDPATNKRQFAVGGPTLNNGRGVIRAFAQVGTDIFEQLGGDIIGDPGERIGTSLCASETGIIGFGTATGYIRLYELDVTG